MVRDPRAHGWSVRDHVKRTTVDLSGYPDLVVMYLGMRLHSLRGIPTLLGFGRRIREAVRAAPDGLLLHEHLAFSPVHLGFRQYWRDFEALERWARSPPHRNWWVEYLVDSKGTGFWHETYFHRGGFEAVYDGIRKPVGLARFAPNEPPVGGMFSARRRLQLEGKEWAPPPIPDLSQLPEKREDSDQR